MPYDSFGYGNFGREYGMGAAPAMNQQVIPLGPVMNRRRQMYAPPGRQAPQYAPPPRFNPQQVDQQMLAEINAKMQQPVPGENDPVSSDPRYAAMMAARQNLGEQNQARYNPMGNGSPMFAAGMARSGMTDSQRRLENYRAVGNADRGGGSTILRMGPQAPAAPAAPDYVPKTKEELASALARVQGMSYAQKKSSLKAGPHVSVDTMNRLANSVKTQQESKRKMVLAAREAAANAEAERYAKVYGAMSGQGSDGGIEAQKLAAQIEQSRQHHDLLREDTQAKRDASAAELAGVNSRHATDISLKKEEIKAIADSGVAKNTLTKQQLQDEAHDRAMKIWLENLKAGTELYPGDAPAALKHAGAKPVHPGDTAGIIASIMSPADSKPSIGASALRQRAMQDMTPEKHFTPSAVLSPEDAHQNAADAWWRLGENSRKNMPRFTPQEHAEYQKLRNEIMPHLPPDLYHDAASEDQLFEENKARKAAGLPEIQPSWDTTRALRRFAYRNVPGFLPDSMRPMPSAKPSYTLGIPQVFGMSQ